MATVLRYLIYVQEKQPVYIRICLYYNQKIPKKYSGNYKIQVNIINHSQKSYNKI